jgi:hypothetical protein
MAKYNIASEQKLTIQIIPALQLTIGVTNPSTIIEEFIF